jgi:O-acetyl-ADP-ribose deacetylase (regulator of RNase III)
MIELTRGNILQADAEALVNTVNCVGIMGKGIALQFKKAFPENFRAYEAACRHKEVRPGRMFVFETGQIFNPGYVINFPAKRHWRGRSRYEDIVAGTRALVEEVRNRNILSIAIPPLGCGLGGLNWDRVRAIVEEAFSTLPDVRVMLYEPKGTPAAENMPIGTGKPRMTIARALLVKVMQQYARHAYRLTLLEIQKLAYFLQESGLELRLHYVKHLYGPYAHNLNKVLEVLEGHYIRGYGDTQEPDVEIELLSGAARRADEFLRHHPEAVEKLDVVTDLVDGFETPYGMELLSSVHWLATHGREATDADTAIAAMRRWNDRKSRLFKPEHIQIAWDRLVEEGWLTEKWSGRNWTVA